MYLFHSSPSISSQCLMTKEEENEVLLSQRPLFNDISFNVRLLGVGGTFKSIRRRRNRRRK